MAVCGSVSKWTFLQPGHLFILLAADSALCNRLVFLVLGNGSVATTNHVSVNVSNCRASPPGRSVMSTHLRLSLIKHGRGCVPVLAVVHPSCSLEGLLRASL